MGWGVRKRQRPPGGVKATCAYSDPESLLGAAFLSVSAACSPSSLPSDFPSLRSPSLSLSFRSSSLPSSLSWLSRSLSRLLLCFFLLLLLRSSSSSSERRSCRELLLFLELLELFLLCLSPRAPPSSSLLASRRLRFSRSSSRSLSRASRSARSSSLAAARSRSLPWYSSNIWRAASGPTSLNSLSFSLSFSNCSHSVVGPMPRTWRRKEAKRSRARFRRPSAASSSARARPCSSSNQARLKLESILPNLSAALSSMGPSTSSYVELEVTTTSASLRTSRNKPLFFSNSTSIPSIRSANNSLGRLPFALRSTTRYASSDLIAGAYSFHRVLTVMRPISLCLCSKSWKASLALRSTRLTSSFSFSLSSRSRRSSSAMYNWNPSSRSILSKVSNSGSPSNLGMALRHSLPILMPGVRSSSSR
mmetsp:Transcript_19039/g.32583  ORF Transcript_19039/g.32583 Transcript_19039/m.32583 type:complete len:420 (+) Transcript_19039:604-1863(+)